MTTRTFRQLGQGYGSTTCQISATVGGVVVHTGAVTTVDQPLPALPDTSLVINNILYTFTRDAHFAGTIPMSITVSGSPLLLAQTQANFFLPVANQSDVWSSPHVVDLGENEVNSDPLTDVTIDGVVQPHQFEVDYKGQWVWIIPAGSTFSATINVRSSYDVPVVP
jgi:hypothetical protein